MTANTRTATRDEEPDDRTEVIGPGIVAVTARNPGPLTLDGTRTWIVGTSVVAIVDPGPDDPAHLDRIARAIGSRPAAAVCLTHSHADHSAAAGKAMKRWGPLHASGATLARLALDGVALSDRDEIRLGDREHLLVVATPGHSGDHLSFQFRPSGEMLTGDLVLGEGSSMVAHPDGSVGAYLTSLARVASLRPRILLPGHGPVVRDADAKLAEYAGHRRERTAQVRAALARGAATLEDLRDDVYGELPAGLRAAAELSLLAHIAHLEELGEVVPELEPLP